ncbi:hypothetical protein [Bacillus phage vB_BceS-M2]|nr:hypothetical protein PBC5_054 [Bacillus phage PBC5]
MANPKVPSVKDNVRKLLEKYPQARNNDKLLFAVYWYEVDKVNMTNGFDTFLKTFNKSTPSSSIQRARQILQYEDKDKEKYRAKPEVEIGRKRAAQMMQDEAERENLLG